jgi:protein TonB
MDSLSDGLWNTSQQRLRKTFSLALVAHGVLLIGLTFAMPAGSPPSPSMDITLAHQPSEEAPDQADFIAQTNQLGTDDQQQMLQPQQPGQQPIAEQQRSDLSEQKILSHTSDQGNLQANQPKADQQQADRGVMQAELDRLQQAYNQIPQVLRMTSVSAKSADAAAYMVYFEEKVEQIGNINYPREARSQGIFGQVQLIVVLLADGRIKRIEVSKGSGSRLLDQAAVRSVQLASPFKPFPKELRNRDEIHIIRTWQYQSNNVLTTN